MLAANEMENNNNNILMKEKKEAYVFAVSIGELY